MTVLIRSVTGKNYYEVCLAEDGFEECCYVSSIQLAHAKESELRAVIRRRAFNAFIEAKSK